MENIKNEIDNLNNKMEELQETIKLKEQELNNLKLQEDCNRHLNFIFNSYDNGRIKQIVSILEKSFNIKFELKKKLFVTIEASYFDMVDDYPIWKIRVTNSHLCVYFFGAYTDEKVKDMLNKVIDCIKQINIKKNYIGVAGLEELLVPEIENSDICFLKI